MGAGVRGSVDFIGYGAGTTPALRRYPGRASAGFLPQIVDPWTGTPLALPDTMYKTAQKHLVSAGCPYFAAIQKQDTGKPFVGPSTSFAMSILLRVDRLPDKLSDPNEAHVVMSYHQAKPGGVELVYIAITPSGRLIGYSPGPDGELSSQIGTVAGDGVYHTVEFSVILQAGPFPGRQSLALDGEVVVERDATALSIPIGDADGRLMILNGLAGRTRFYGSAAYARFDHSSGERIIWPFDEGSGTSIVGTDSGPPLFDGTRPDYDLTLDFYDPSALGFPLLWGPIPARLNDCFSWSRKTVYTPRDPVQPEYHPVGGPA